MNRIFIFVLFVLIAFITFYQNAVADVLNLDTDGVQLFKHVFNEDELKHLKNKCGMNRYVDAKHFLLRHPSLTEMVNNISSEHQLQDYIMIAKKQADCTCHAESETYKHPSYIMIIYVDGGNLSVIPGSHADTRATVVDLICEKGDIVIFNSKLIKAYHINNTLQIQLKIAHMDELEYKNVIQVLDTTNNLPALMIKAQAMQSCLIKLI